MATQLRPDLILLDWILRGESGEDVLRALKADDTTRLIPVVMISGILQSPEDYDLALRLGAECLLIKLDMSIAAFAHRIEDILMLPEPRPSSFLIRGRIRVDMERRKVWVAGEPRSVPGKRFELLALLLRHPEGVTRDMLMSGGYAADPSSIAKTVQRLREDLRFQGEDGVLAIRHGYELIG